MKKHRRLFFIFSLAAQLISYAGAVFMLCKKKKPAAGVFAAVGIIGTIFGIALLNTPAAEKDKSGTSKQLKRQNRTSPEKAEREKSVPARGFSESTDKEPNANAAAAPAPKVTFEQPRVVFEKKPETEVTSAFDSEKEEPEKEGDMERLSRAIEILKGTSEPAEKNGNFDDISTELEAELAKLDRE